MFEKGVVTVGPHEFPILPDLTENVVIVQLKNLQILRRNEFVGKLIGHKLVVLAIRDDADLQNIKETDYVAVATDLGGQPFSVRIGFLNLVLKGSSINDSSNKIVETIQARYKKQDLTVAA